MDLSAHIRDLITVAQQMKTDKVANPKVINKVVSKLEDAIVWADQLHEPERAGSYPSKDAFNCTCPDGAVDTINCPVHRAKS